MKQDTIVAIATPPGEGGIGVVRLSGADAPTIGSRLFRGRLRDRRAIFGHVQDPSTGEVVDEAIGILMRAPRTYTREHTVELQTHGSSVCLRRIVELSLREGARAAEPGEFTLRAFVNGRLDLAQAEAVLDVIQAQTETSLRLAVQGLGGRLSQEIQSLRRRLLDMLAYLGARADFPDEDVPAADLTPAINDVIGEIQSLLATAEHGMVYRQGTRIAIIGSPNVGKSSLMNRLLREDRVIVTPVAGTTRDTVEETVNIAGVPITLVDTAGLEESSDKIERIGIARTRAAIEHTDALIVVLDSSRKLLPSEWSLLDETASRPRLIVANKCDLPPPDGAWHEEHAAIALSALTGDGIAAFEQRLAELATGGRVLTGDSTVVTNPRHKAALARALAQLQLVAASLALALPEDLVTTDLRTAVESIGEITGEAVTEDLLDAIFRNFCIGK